jgi:hypothetical protein
MIYESIEKPYKESGDSFKVSKSLFFEKAAHKKSGFTNCS